MTVEVAVSVALKYEYLTPADPLPFDEVLTNLQGHFDDERYSLIVPYSGYYLNCISGATSTYTGIDLGLMVNGQKQVGIK